MTISPNELFEFISSKLASITEKSRSWPQIERGLFDILIERGKKEGYSVYARGAGKDKGEYLIDLCWYFEQGSLRKWMEMACEIEWSSRDTNEITYDMWKLTDVKANLKLGISSPKAKDKDGVIAEVASIIRDHAIKMPNEQYVMIYAIYQPYVEEKERFNVLGYCYDSIGNEVLLGDKKVAWGYYLPKALE